MILVSVFGVSIIVIIIIAVIFIANQNKNQYIQEKDLIDTEIILDDSDNGLLTVSQEAIKRIIDASIDNNLIKKLEEAGFEKEIIDLIKVEMQTYLPIYNDGIYEGIADAHNGTIKVEVTIHEGKIIYIEVVDHSETAPKLPEVFKSIPIDILKNQSTDQVDVVSGATEASEGYLNAVRDALNSALN